MIDKNIFKWDAFSDQPYPIRDKKVKKEIYKCAFVDTIKTIIINILLFPFISVRFGLSFFEKKTVCTNDFFGMSVNLDKEPNLSASLIKELGVKNILIRFPLNDVKNISKYKNFIKSFQGCNIIVNILQDREHITDKALLQKSIYTIFSTLDVKEYQIANAINRKKWGFFTMDEYLRFYKTIQNIRDKDFPHIKLIGSSVIDFEYHFSVRTLFNFYKIHYDKYSSLLYVDRRGSPQNTQMGLDLIKKINLLYSIVTLSPKTENKIIITETNWPISSTAPYAPTSEKECVNLNDYAFYMLQYYLLSLSTGMIEKIYWHQLIAPGYGLIDNRDGLKKYPAFYAYKTMVSLLQGAKLIAVDLKDKIKYMKFEKKDKTIEIYWSDKKRLPKQNSGELLSLYGEKYSKENFVYIINSKKSDPKEKTK